MQAGHQVEHHQGEEQRIGRRTPAADAAQEQGVEAVLHQRAVDQRQQQQAGGGDDQHAAQGRGVHRQRRAEQQVQQVDAPPGQAEQQHAAGQCDRVDGGQTGVFAQAGTPRHPGRQRRHAEAGDQAAGGQGRQAQAVQPERQRRAGQYAVGDGIAHQAHAAQHQEHPQRGDAQDQRHATGQGAAQEGEFGEGLPQQVEHQATCASGASSRSRAGPQRQPSARICRQSGRCARAPARS